MIHSFSLTVSELQGEQGVSLVRHSWLRSLHSTEVSDLVDKSFKQMCLMVCELQ